MNRKTRRASAKITKKFSNIEIEEKLSLVANLDSECLACLRAFDKTNTHMVNNWTVVVRNDETHLYCPACWSLAADTINSSITK
jgi:hypothetical protein